MHMWSFQMEPIVISTVQSESELLRWNEKQISLWELPYSQTKRNPLISAYLLLSAAVTVALYIMRSNNAPCCWVHITVRSSFSSCANVSVCAYQHMSMVFQFKMLLYYMLFHFTKVQRTIAIWRGSLQLLLVLKWLQQWQQQYYS